MKPATRKTFVDKRLKWKMEQPVPGRMAGVVRHSYGG